MNGILAHPRLLGLVCGASAVGLGVMYMLAAGAPSRYLLVNMGALALGTTAWLTLRKVAAFRFAGAGLVILALAGSLLLTAQFGVPVEGASRWVNVGPLNLQVSLIVVPVVIVMYARWQGWIGTAGIVVAALALAVQPDRAMAGVLMAGLLALTLTAPRRLPIMATMASILAFGYTLFAPDALPAVPYVDRVFYTAFDVHVLAGAAVVIGAAILIAPAMIGASNSTSERSVLLAFGACWAGVIVAAALGNYPTPLVGYGGSAVLGYLLAVTLLPNGALEVNGVTFGSRPSIDRSSDQTVELCVPHIV
jgi:cell division protein FtsW (lipid II flippase)